MNPCLLYTSSDTFIVKELSLERSTERVGPDSLPGFFEQAGPAKQIEHADFYMSDIERALSRQDPKVALDAISFAERDVAELPVEELRELMTQARDQLELVDQLYLDLELFREDLAYARDDLELAETEEEAEELRAEIEALAASIPEAKIELDAAIEQLLSLIHICLGLLASFNRGKPLDRGVMFLAVLGMSISYLVYVIVGQYFGAQWPRLAFDLEIFSTFGYEPVLPIWSQVKQGLIDNGVEDPGFLSILLSWFGSVPKSLSKWPYYCLLPVIIGVIVAMGYDTRFYRAVMVEECNKDYIRTVQLSPAEAFEMAKEELEPLLIPASIFADDRGWSVMNLMQGVLGPAGQINYSVMYPSVIKAWHRHTKQTDFWLCINGHVKTGVFRESDGRRWMAVVGERRPGVVIIPPPLWHGCATVGHEPAGLLYYVTHQYDPSTPDEFRMAHDAVEQFPWSVQHG